MRDEPVERYGIKVMSSGFIVSEDQAVVLNAGLAGALLTQLVWSTRWGTLDYLVIDLSPGTSDGVQETFRLLPAAAAVLVVTPQDVAHLDNRAECLDWVLIWNRNRACSDRQRDGATDIWAGRTRRRPGRTDTRIPSRRLTVTSRRIPADAPQPAAECNATSTTHGQLRPRHADPVSRRTMSPRWSSETAAARTHEACATRCALAGGDEFAPHRAEEAPDRPTTWEAKAYKPTSLDHAGGGLRANPGHYL
jgi:hypothetical protein